jgi:L-fuconolactonase
MRIDAHQHYWRFSADEYGWIQPTWPLRRDFLPEHVAPHLAAHGFAGALGVQARQSLEETAMLLELADKSEQVLGVVGWVDLCAPDVADSLERWCAQPKLKGVRHLVQDEPDPDFLLRPDFQRGLTQLTKRGLVYDLLVFPRHLPAALSLVRRLPEQRFVLDHIAKPDIQSGVMSGWKEPLQELAACPNVFCKVSGLVTEADWQSWQPEHVLPYLDVVLAAFGSDRLIYGSDWPVCLLAADYEQVLALAERFAAQLSSAEQAGFFGGNAARCYGIAAP